jgi:hypothetical protein
MSDILRRIITRFEAQPGNVRAVLGGVGQSYSQAATGANRLAREQSYLNNQLRAFGTTVRYAIAGGAIFGAAGTISTLAEIQTQLGLISAIGQAGSPTGQGVALVGDRLNDLSQQARQAAISTVQPLSAINEGIISLLSTVRNVPQNQIVPMVEEISRAATLSQISTEEATKNFLAMQTAFGKPINLQNVRKSAQEFFMLISRVPGGPATGAQILQQFGQLAAVSRGGRISQPELMGLITAGLRTGIPPAQYGRGLQYMIQTVTRQRPLAKDAAALMDELGITPSFVATTPHGGMAALGRIIDRVRAAGGLGGNIKAQVQRLSALEEEIGPEGAIPKALLSGPGANVASTIFRRVHEYRAFLALYARATQAKGTIADPTLAQEIKDMIDAENGHVQDIENLSKAWQRFTDRAKLKQASIALQALGQDVITAFEPVLNFAAKGITGLGSLATRHQDFTQGLALAGGLAGLFIGGRRFLRGARVGGGVLAVAQGVTGAQGPWKGIPGESPQHPMFVWVIGTGLKFGGGGAVPVGVPGGGGPGGAAGRTGRWGRFGRFGGGALRAAGWAGLAYAGMELTDPLLDKIPHWRDSPQEEMKKKQAILLGQKGAAQYWYDPATRKYSLTQEGAKMGISEKVAAKSLGTTIQALDKMIERSLSGKAVLKGQASVDLNVNMKQPDGQVVKKKAKVTVDMFPNFMDSPLKPPSSRGKAQTSR